MSQWYQLTGKDVLETLETSEEGLKDEVISSLQKKHGQNRLEAAKQKTKLAIFISQFKDLMILILGVAAVISFLVGEHTDAYVILAIIVGNAFIGFSQESNAEESVKMLQKMAAQYAIVIRSNKPKKIDSNEIVPGDIIALEAGDIVPADGRLISVSSLKIDEAALTGESHSIEKIVDALKEDELSLGDQLNMVFKGTIVSNGTAKMVVTSTGMDTEIGRIAGLLDVDDQKTPLQKRLTVFSKQLAVIVIMICLVVFAFGLFRGEPPFVMFLTALSLAVAALPEALPAVVTIALSGGARRMVRQKALMRNLPAVETLGSVTYICSDKTGTLTQNVMTVEKVEEIADEKGLLMKAMLLNNEVRFADEELLGDSTETAMVKYALESGLNKGKVEDLYPLVIKVPFDSERMRMSTLHQHEDKWILFVKGAPSRIADVLSKSNKGKINEWLNLNRQWAAEGLRVLFFAYKIFDEKPPEKESSLEKDLDLLGIVAMIDPPREEVVGAIKECKTAGIHTVMITGDQPLTASAIARRLNILDQDSDEIISGTELSKLSEAELKQKVTHISVYARVSPEQKLSIVKALQSNGHFVSMTGDGVNDAPSLKQANIGVAMGITGTAVSKEAADMILLDDNFATIVKAVKEGRRIYENVKKFVLYVLSCNLGEILTIFMAPFFGLAIPLLPIHILWINLVTDGLPGLALAAEPAEKDIMNKPPRPPKENLFAGGMIAKILTTGTIMTVAAILTQVWASKNGYDTRTQQTMIFTLLCFIQLGNAFSVRSAYNSIFSSQIFLNRGMWGAFLLTVALQLSIVYIPGLHGIFKTTALGWHTMSVVLMATVASVICIELVKLIMRKHKN